MEAECEEECERRGQINLFSSLMQGPLPRFQTPPMFLCLSLSCRHPRVCLGPRRVLPGASALSDGGRDAEDEWGRPAGHPQRDDMGAGGRSREQGAGAGSRVPHVTAHFPSLSLSLSLCSLLPAPSPFLVTIPPRRAAPPRPRHERVRERSDHAPGRGAGGRRVRFARGVDARPTEGRAGVEGAAGEGAWEGRGEEERRGEERGGEEGEGGDTHSHALSHSLAPCLPHSHPFLTHTHSSLTPIPHSHPFSLSLMTSIDGAPRALPLPAPGRAALPAAVHGAHAGTLYRRASARGGTLLPGAKLPSRASPGGKAWNQRKI